MTCLRVAEHRAWQFGATNRICSITENDVNMARLLGGAVTQQ